MTCKSEMNFLVGVQQSDFSSQVHFIYTNCTFNQHYFFIFQLDKCCTGMYIFYLRLWQ